MRSLSHSDGISIRRSSPLRTFCAAAAGMALLAPGAARAAQPAPAYQTAPLMMSGDSLGATRIPIQDELFVDGLTDNGAILFHAGQLDWTRPDMLAEWTNGKFFPIVIPGAGPGVLGLGDLAWPPDVTLEPPVGMNAHGDAVFSANRTDGYHSWGTFLWSAQAQETSRVALDGMIAPHQMTITEAGGSAPAVNDRGEVALVARVKNPNGPSGYGLFRVDPNGFMNPVLLPEQRLTGANDEFKPAATDAYSRPSIDNAGRVAFIARIAGEARPSAYLWRDGEIVPVLLSGARSPDGGHFTLIAGVYLNNNDSTILVAAATDRGMGPQYGLYRIKYGGAKPVVVPGQTLPDGGTLQTINYTYHVPADELPMFAVSGTNTSGQMAFVGTRADGSSACYRVDANGSLTLAYGTATGSVQIADVSPPIRFVRGSHPSINNHGQIALAIHPIGAHSMIMLLTPSPS